MFVKAAKRIAESTFPIFLAQQISPSTFNYSVAGTGFFVRPDGYFISVAHVFSKSPDCKYEFRGRTPHEVVGPFVITEIARDDDQDLFIGHIAFTNKHYMKVSAILPNIGQSVCIAGYPLTIMALQDNVLYLGGVRRYLQPSFVLDHGSWRSKLTDTTFATHEGFSVRDFGLYGMSGGPVVDIRGSVVGIQGSVSDPRTSTNGKDSITVQNGIAINTQAYLTLAASVPITFGNKASRAA